MDRRLRTTPMTDFGYLFDQMDHMAHEMLAGGTRTTCVATLPVDVYDRGDEVIVQAYVPGVHADHLDVQIDDGVLTIAGSFPELYSQEDNIQEWTWYTRELRSGQFQCSINLPFKIDLDQARVDDSDGGQSYPLSPTLTGLIPFLVPARGTKFRWTAIVRWVCISR